MFALRPRVADIELVLMASLIMKGGLHAEEPYLLGREEQKITQQVTTVHFIKELTLIRRRFLL